MSETVEQGAFSFHFSTAHSSYKEQAYHRIKDAILYRRLEVGVMYSQESICQELGIKRTPVREALLALQQEGLVSYSRNRGVQILPITQTEAHSILEARIMVEKISASLAAQRANAGELMILERCLKDSYSFLNKGDACLSYRIDHQFHRAIAEMTHNSWISRMTDLTLDQYLRFEDTSIYLNEEGARIILAEHQKVFDAIVQHNPQEAEVAMNTHLSNAYSRTVHIFWY